MSITIDNIVSIHPMCRFKILLLLYRNSYLLVSIHPMCRFKEEIFAFSHLKVGFNTSYVSVQVALAKSTDPFAFVSIHPMCRFKKMHIVFVVVTKEVSIHPMCRFK